MNLAALSMIQWVRVARYYSHFHISHLVMWLKIKYCKMLLYSLKGTREWEWVCKKEKTKTTTTAMTTNAEQNRWKWMQKWQWSRMRWYENSCASWFIFSGKPTHLSQKEWDMHSMHIAHWSFSRIFCQKIVNERVVRCHWWTHGAKSTEESCAEWEHTRSL